MSSTHTLLFNGYLTSAERLLEDVMFEVAITETPGLLAIQAVVPPTSPPHVAGYLRRINTTDILPEIREIVQKNIDHLMACAQDEGKTINDLLDEWERDEPDRPRIELLNEV